MYNENTFRFGYAKLEDKFQTGLLIGKMLMYQFLGSSNLTNVSFKLAFLVHSILKCIQNKKIKQIFNGF